MSCVFFQMSIDFHCCLIMREHVSNTCGCVLQFPNDKHQVHLWRQRRASGTVGFAHHLNAEMHSGGGFQSKHQPIAAGMPSLAKAMFVNTEPQQPHITYYIFHRECAFNDMFQQCKLSKITARRMFPADKDCALSWPRQCYIQGTRCGQITHQTDFGTRAPLKKAL